MPTVTKEKLRQKITSLTAEQKAQIPAWNAKWEKIILATGPCDRDIVTKAVEGMYAAAKLDRPRVIFVPSPLVAALAGSIAAGIWWLRTPEGKEHARKYFGGSAATGAATDAATRDEPGLSQEVKFLLNCCQFAYRNMNGGNHWASWCCFLSFWRDVVGLELEEHKNYVHYEMLTIHSGWRYMHEKFCLVSDRPTVLKTVIRNGEHVAHCEDGPSHRWSDGWSLWHIHGVKVDEQIVLRPETQTVAQIKSESNEEVRRVRIERFGWERYLKESGARQCDRRFNDRDAQWEQLYRLDDGSQRAIVSDPSTGRKYALGVPKTIKTCAEAQNWLSHGLDRRAVHRS